MAERLRAPKDVKAQSSPPAGKRSAKRAPKRAVKTREKAGKTPVKAAVKASAAPRTPARAPKKPSRLVPPPQADVMQAAFDLSRQLSLEVREEELVGTFVSTLGRLLPGRYLCLRVIDPRTQALTSMISDGPLTSGESAMQTATLAVKRSALRRTRLSDSVTQSARVRIVDGYERVFRDSAGGFSVPLVASGEMFGLLNVEYPPPFDLCEDDEPVTIPLANQLSVALRNLNLLGEARYYRDYLRKMIDVANAFIIVVDRDARIAVMNRAMQRYLGFPASIIGTPLEEVRKRSTAAEPRLSTLLLAGLRGVEYSDCEVPLWQRHVQKLGRAMFNTSVMRGPDGSIDGVIAIGNDIERMRSLERQVIQAEKLATLGQLAAGVVHELNNPLTSISVYGDYLVRLLDRVGDKPDVDKATKVVEGAARIQKLTRDLMSYARPSGEPEWVSINEVVKQALTFCEHVVRRAEAEVTLTLGDDLPRVHAIRAQLHQVLINLITNACHALGRPGGGVRLGTSMSADGRMVRISVHDDGCGIGAGDRDRVFEPFFTTKKDGKGTGLGLSIVKNIVEGHGGHVGFDSDIGDGTTFVITLPLKKETVVV
ncbi:MAG TPA: ATP-binding protein [Polyangia bacterium]|nr:ATP-binding protein [Polyangia bacterium]